MEYRNRIPFFPQNRVWRTYPGGKVLDQLVGKTPPQDTHFPEDWIGSVTSAKNPGREEIEEGVSTVQIGSGTYPFDELIAADPEYFLGRSHIAAFGAKPQLLVKLLDSAIRLHFQCHPTAEFAQTRMNEPSGKAEAYYILAIREEVKNPYVYIGFQRPPEKEQLKSWIENQDLESISACMDKIPVQPGDALFIPGGFPHAIGEGILMVEIMEPSDLAIRFEFEKAGYILPESARFMGRGLDFCLEAFDYSQTSLEKIQQEYFFSPQLLREYDEGKGKQYHLIGNETTPCMQVKKSVITGPIEKREKQCFIGIITKGSAVLSKDGEKRQVSKFDKFFYPAKFGDLTIDPNGTVEILECYPPVPPKE